MRAADLCGNVFRAEGAGNAKTPGATSLGQLRAASGRGRGAGGGRTPRRRRAPWPTRLTSHSPSAPLPTPARDTSREEAKPRHPHAAERIGHRTRTTRPKESNRPDLNPAHKKQCEAPRGPTAHSPGGTGRPAAGPRRPRPPPARLTADRSRRRARPVPQPAPRGASLSGAPGPRGSRGNRGRGAGHKTPGPLSPPRPHLPRVWAALLHVGLGLGTGPRRHRSARHIRGPAGGSGGAPATASRKGRAPRARSCALAPGLTSAEREEWRRRRGLDRQGEGAGRWAGGGAGAGLWRAEVALGALRGRGRGCALAPPAAAPIACRLLASGGGLGSPRGRPSRGGRVGRRRCGRGEGRAGGLAEREEGSAGGRSEEAAQKGGVSRGSHHPEPDKPCGETGCPLVTVPQLSFGCSLLKANKREARVRRKERCFNQKSRQSGEEVDSRPEINSEDSAQP